MKMGPAVRRLESVSKAREARWKEHNAVCTRSTDATNQDVGGTCSTASRDQYLPQSQVEKSTPADSENNLTSGSDETEIVLFSFLREMHSSIPKNYYCVIWYMISFKTSPR